LRAQKKEAIDLIVIGPETLLEQGWSDQLRDADFLVLGPSQASSKLETSKLFAKEFMKRAGIPTAEYTIANSKKALVDEIDQNETWPLVLKLDALAAGKGVCVAQDKTQAIAFANRIWDTQDFGSGPHSVLAEAFLAGNEVSYIGVTDGKKFVPMATATDYKRVGENDQGANTGGMGCVSPSPFFTPALEEKIHTRIIQPTLDQLLKESLDYRGTLFVGLMISPSGDPFVVEYNVRFGDPETQVTLLRLKSDFAQLLHHTASQKLDECPPQEWRSETAVFVVGAAEGYPLKVTKGDKIEGVVEIGAETEVFYSGVKGASITDLVTSGGRVLGIGAVESSLEKARESAYRNMDKISWRGKHIRRDIGQVR